MLSLVWSPRRLLPILFNRIYGESKVLALNNLCKSHTPWERNRPEAGKVESKYTTNCTSFCFWMQHLLWYQCENKVQQRCLVSRRAADQYSINSAEEMFQKRHQISWGTSQLDPSEHHIHWTDENRWEQMLKCIWRAIAWVSLWLCRRLLELNYVIE